MHKFFAKTLFLGKKVIFLPECHSTNQELQSLQQTSQVADGTVVLTDYQSRGRGQRGNHWHSQAGENLLVSVFLKTPWMSLREQFFLNIFSGVSIREAIQEYTSERVLIKWPNDLYVDKQKIGGILCESVISGGTMEASIVGFGLNVNQVHFDLESATSLKLLTRKELDRSELLESILLSMEKYYWMLKANNQAALMTEYYKNLLWMNEIGTFETDHRFEGKITGIDGRGRLMVEKHTGEEPVLFDIKEIKFVM